MIHSWIWLYNSKSRNVNSCLLLCELKKHGSQLSYTLSEYWKWVYMYTIYNLIQVTCISVEILRYLHWNCILGWSWADCIIHVPVPHFHPPQLRPLPPLYMRACIPGGLAGLQMVRHFVALELKVSQVFGVLMLPKYMP